MRGNRLIPTLCLVAGLTLAGGTAAQSPAAVAGQSEFDRSQQQISTMVIGAPRTANVPAQPEKRPYRDPTVPLTIGEMAEIQRQKATEDFLKKAGFTTEKPAPKDEGKASQEALPEKVERRLATRAVYGRAGQRLSADLQVDDALIRVSEGSKIAGRFVVKAVEQSTVVFTTPKSQEDCRTLARQQRRKCLAEPKTFRVSVGQQHSWFE